MIYVIGNFILFCAIGVIVFYTNKIHHIQDENTSQYEYWDTLVRGQKFKNYYMTKINRNY
ncbi:hypothetical protein [Tetragenococcus muriaticus]|uniref:Uncharacterized protein n=1 Tax=Tetragenococcus muriaticus 3MR10-3 TaxID=1302648 RepID=A0A091C2R9_9ENTE|nr:hypothetical protein [Tetragenococcus muriaticus]KFN90990.1 hypothetical protein TMU3MR103_1216 [Tetragenococcus muriaticus 3MR10-3]GMA47136.1 hypothetical protein GCM10025854_13860 [Tetragenococcus muriaticus]